MEKHRIILATGLFLIVSPIILAYVIVNVGGPLQSLSPITAFILLFSGIVLFIYGTTKEIILKSKGVIVDDERTKKIKYKARSYTLTITIFFIMLLFMLNHYEIIDLELIHMFWIIVVVVAITQLFFYWLLNFMGDL
jgi:hypothetical protein